MRKTIICVALVFLAGCLAASQKPSQLSPSEYEKLRAQALAKAGLHAGPKIKNPNISHDDGLDAEMLGTLLHQRIYFQSSHTLVASAAPKPAASRMANSGQTSPASCRAPIIKTVNGKGQGAIFTPQSPDNLYKIEGCFFGNTRGQVQLEPHSTALGQSAVPIVLQIDSSLSAWSDNEIDVHLDPRLTGLPDSPVTLVVYPGKGQRMELPGCFFVAVRGTPQLLSAIPSSWVNLDASATRTRPAKQLEYVSPPARGSDVPYGAAGTSAFVIRSDSESFAVGRDVYDFSRLNPGWVVDSVQLQTYSLSCPGSVSSTESSGNWGLQWGQHNFAVTLEDDVCISSVPPSFVFSMSLSQYAATVWVVGPVGTQPVPSIFLGKNE